MSDRNTSISRSQLKPIRADDFDATNSPENNYVAKYDSATGKFTWIAVAGGVSVLSDLTDILFDTGTPTDGQALVYDTASGKWKAQTISATDEKVKATSGDTAGYLDAKVDDDTIEISNNKLKLASRIENNIMLAFFKLSIVGGLSKYSLVDGMEDEFEDETGVDTASSTNESYNSTDDYYTPSSVAGGWDAYTKLVIDFNGSDGATTHTARTGQTVTFIGTAQLDTAQKEFGTASLLLDGNSDYVTLVDSDDWTFGDGDFTIDFWWRTDSAVANEHGFCGQVDGGNFWYFTKVQYNDVAGELVFRSYNSSANIGLYKSEGLSWAENTWYHIAFVRSGSTSYIFRNGVSLDVTQTTAWSTQPNLSSTLLIGYHPSKNYTSGWIDEFRISKGIARWTNNFTPPTSEYSTGGGVTLLIHFNGTDTQNTYTAETGQTITFVGTAQLDTAQKEFGSACLLLDGNSDYVTVPDNATWAFGTADHVIDCWLRWNSTTGRQNIFVFGDVDATPYSLSFTGDATNQWWLVLDGGLAKTWDDTISTNTWYHIELVKSNGKFKLFRNGTQIGASFTSSYSILQDPLTIGAHSTGALRWFNGWIDEFRITTDVAHCNFTPPIAEYEEDPAEYDNMILISNTYTADSEPTTSRLVLFEEDIDAITLNTDLKGYISRDGGTTWTQVTLTDEGDYETDKRILSSVAVDISGQPSGSSMKWKIETLNEKQLKLHGVGAQWNA